MKIQQNALQLFIFFWQSAERARTIKSDEGYSQAT